MYQTLKGRFIMKKIFTLVLALVIALSAFAPCFAAEYVDVEINGQKIEFDVPAQIINDRTMVPMRKIFETLGAEVEWYEAEQGILALTPQGKVIVMKIGANRMIVGNIATNEEKKVELDVPPMLVDSRTLVPVRAISESLGYNVEWVEETQTVKISK